MVSTTYCTLCSKQQQHHLRAARKDGTKTLSCTTNVAGPSPINNNCGVDKLLRQEISEGGWVTHSKHYSVRYVTNHQAQEGRKIFGSTTKEDWINNEVFEQFCCPPYTHWLSSSSTTVVSWNLPRKQEGEKECVACAYTTIFSPGLASRVERVERGTIDLVSALFLSR